MKRIILFALIVLLIGCVYAEDFKNITVNGNHFEIPQKYSNGDSQNGKYVYNDLRTFAILCVDDYLIASYGGYYDIKDSSQESSVDGRPVKLLTMHNKYIDKNVSYLYLPVNRSIYCICYQGNEITDEISHIVRSAPESGMTSDTFYGLLNEAYNEHENRQYLDTIANDDSNYVSQKNQYNSHSNDNLVKWYLLTHW